MSKKKRRRRRYHQRSVQKFSSNRHHLLYQARHWNTPYAKQLRTAFVRVIPVKVHDELHNAVLKDIPKPPERLLKGVWISYQHDKATIDEMGICQAILWLYDHIPDEAFRATMLIQYHFFQTKLASDP